MPLIDILIPEEIGPVDECVVVTWLKREGDSVKQGQDLLIIQAEKASYDVPSPATGAVSAILVQQGEVAKQGQPLARLEVSQADVPTAPPAELEPEPAAAAPSSPPSQVRASPIAKRLARQHSIDLTQVSGSGPDGRITEKDIQAIIDAQTAPAEVAAPAKEVRASPIARRIAREYGLDLADIPGADQGRITEKDVRAYLDAHQKTEPQSSPSAATPASNQGRSIPMAGMRAAIAQRMHQSLQEMAQLTLHTEADVTELVALRDRLKQSLPVTYTDLIVKASALALRQHPHLNATLAGDTIQLLPDIHIGLAVALEAGLIVPVLRHADQQSLADLVRSRVKLVERAQANQLTPAEYTGGTFTVTNLGAFDIDAFTPIVNPPEAAILGVGRIVDKVVIHHNKIAQRSMLTLSLSFDHRLVDGAPAAAFLQTLKRHLEQPAALE